MYLSRLRIQNLALVDALDAEFSSGVIAVTGETGAGKSMILGSLHLLLGHRADADWVRKGASRAVVEGVFDLDDTPADDARRAALAAQGFELGKEEPLILRREVSESGRSSASIAGRMAAIGQLAEIAQSFVDIHSQHDQQSLSQKRWQRQALDAFAGTEDLARRVRDQHAAWHACRKELDDWMARERELRRHEDLLRFQLAEITKAELRNGEEQDLEQRENVLANAEDLKSTSASLLDLLEEEQSGMLVQLQHAARLAQHLQQVDRDTHDWIAAVSSALISLNDLRIQAASYASRLDVDPGELVMVQNRLHEIAQLKKKYGNSVSEILGFAEKIEEELKTVGSFDEHVGELQRRSDALFATLGDLAADLTEKRRKAAKKLAAQVVKELAQLGMQQAAFTVSLTPLPEVGASGGEDIEFLIAVNPGEDPKPISKVASGGELSRITLALKCVATSRDDVPLLVFDEIDAGVSGTVAHAVGERLHKLGATHQIFVITHLPQIACRSSEHFAVTKSVAGSRTTTEMHLLPPGERENEIARMLGGASATALAHARELLSGNGEARRRRTP